jgi:hypothetical protein
MPRRWADVTDQALFRGLQLGAEVPYLHRRSRSLLVGDVVWNVTQSMQLARRACGQGGGHAGTPAFRLGIRDLQGARDAVRRVISWDFDRTIVGHGEIVQSSGREAFKRACRRLAA